MNEGLVCVIVKRLRVCFAGRGFMKTKVLGKQKPHGVFVDFSRNQSRFFISCRNLTEKYNLEKVAGNPNQVVQV